MRILLEINERGMRLHVASSEPTDNPEPTDPTDNPEPTYLLWIWCLAALVLVMVVLRAGGAL